MVKCFGMSGAGGARSTLLEEADCAEERVAVSPRDGDDEFRVTLVSSDAARTLVPAVEGIYVGSEFDEL